MTSHLLPFHNTKPVLLKIKDMLIKQQCLCFKSLSPSSRVATLTKEGLLSPKVYRLPYSENSVLLKPVLWGGGVAGVALFSTAMNKSNTTESAVFIYLVHFRASKGFNYSEIIEHWNPHPETSWYPKCKGIVQNLEWNELYWNGKYIKSTFQCLQFAPTALDVILSKFFSV